MMWLILGIALLASMLVTGVAYTVREFGLWDAVKSIWLPWVGIMVWVFSAAVCIAYGLSQMGVGE